MCFRCPSQKQASRSKPKTSIFISNRGNLLRLDFDKIAYLESAGQGESFVVTDSETHQVDITLNRFLELLPTEKFQRISRTNVVNISNVLKINREERSIALRCGAKIKNLGIGDIYYTELLKLLPVAK